MEASPYTPGAGYRPPFLAGRDEFVRLWNSALNDVAAQGRLHSPDLILTAPRGVGKTATVLKFEDLCTAQGFEVISLQAAAGNATLVESLLERAQAGIDGHGTNPSAWERARRVFDRIASVNVSVLGSGAGIATHPQAAPGRRPVSPEVLAGALATLDREVRAERPQAGVLLTIDEIQASARPDLTLVAAALQDLNRHHPDAHVMFAASGLPNTQDVLTAAGVTHPDRLFDIHSVALLLEPEDARVAITEPALARQVSWEPAAAELLVTVSRGYPAHLQVFADETWRAAKGPRVISLQDAESGIQTGAALLERRSLGPRFETMTDREREFLAALATLGGSAPANEVAFVLGRSRDAVSYLRADLITHGDLYVPQRGDIALTSPIFGPYLLAHYDDMRQSRTATELMTAQQLQARADSLEPTRVLYETGVPIRGELPPARQRQPLKPGDAVKEPRTTGAQEPGGHSSERE